VNLWRIATETRSYRAEDLSGGGAARYPGRWNAEQEAMVYAAPSVALAVLETAAHVDDHGLPLNKFLVRIEVPDAVWACAEHVRPEELPASWLSIPAGQASVRFGSDWLHSLRSTILLVPSVIVPEESIALINPRHPDAAKLRAEVVRLHQYNALFRKG
jgi:RES domain-containing protein